MCCSVLQCVAVCGRVLRHTCQNKTYSYKKRNCKSTWIRHICIKRDVFNRRGYCGAVCGGCAVCDTSAISWMWPRRSLTRDSICTSVLVVCAASCNCSEYFCWRVIQLFSWFAIGEEKWVWSSVCMSELVVAQFQSAHTDDIHTYTLTPHVCIYTQIRTNAHTRTHAHTHIHTRTGTNLPNPGKFEDISNEANKMFLLDTFEGFSFLNIQAFQFVWTGHHQMPTNTPHWPLRTQKPNIHIQHNAPKRNVKYTRKFWSTVLSWTFGCMTANCR